MRAKLDLTWLGTIFWSSQVFELVESSLHIVDVLGLSGLADWCSDLSCAGIDLATSFHDLLVLHRGEQLHDLAVVNRSGVNVIECGIHVSCLDIEVLEDLLEVANRASHTKRIHLLHALLQHGDRLLDLRRDLLRPVRRFQLGRQGTHFHTEAAKIDCLLPVADHILGVDLCVFHLVLVEGL